MDTPSHLKVSADTREEERSVCGFRQRLITKEHGAPLSITRLRTSNAQAHWHRHTHECYYVLAGEGKLLIDNEEVSVQAGDCVWIMPGHQHQAIGSFETLIICTPPLEPDDVILGTPPE